MNNYYKQYSYAVYVLFKRDLVTTFRRSYIGWLWLLLNPLVGAASWIVMKYAGLLKFSSNTVEYPVFVVFSIMLWQLFLSSYSNMSSVLINAGSFISQVKFPRELLIVKQMMHQLTLFFFAFIATLILMILFGYVPNMYLILLPLICLPILLAATSLGAMVSIFQVVLPEIKVAADLFVNLLFFITPVVYSLSEVTPGLYHIVKYNPLAYLIGWPRDVILYSQAQSVGYYLASVGFVVLISAVSWSLFRRFESLVVERF